MCFFPFCVLKHALGGGEGVVPDVAADGLLESAGKSLEDGFDLVVLVVTLRLDVQVHGGGVAEGLEEVQEHLGGHFANLFALEFSVPDQPAAASEVEHYLSHAVVHGEGVTVALYATFITQGLADALAKHDSGILDCVVLVNVQISLDLDGQVHAAVTANLLQHVVKESKAGADVALA